MYTRTLQDETDVKRNKGVSSPFGKILKGTISQAPIKLNVSSIPTKYQNVIFQPQSKPAFGESKRRFFQLAAHDTSQTPGPGCYNLSASTIKVQSKKGSGFFASESKLQKLQRVRSHVPGPGAYKVGQLKSKSLKKLNFSKFKLNQSELNTSKSTALLSSTIQNSRQIFKNEIQNSKTKPSVGTYEINPQKLMKLKSSYSTFKSKIERFTIHQDQIPPIGFYDVTRSRPSKSQIGSTKKINYKKENEFVHEKNIHKAFRNLQKQEQKEKLGPGTYNPGLESTSKTFQIKDNMHDRFGELKPIYLMSKAVDLKEKQQTKVQHSHLNKIQMAKTYHSIFKSTTQRWDFKLKNQMDPGTYNPNKSSPSKSHLINFLQKWI